MVLLGIVTEVEEDRIAVTRQDAPTGIGGAQILISLESVIEWDYSDLREAPGDVREGPWGIAIKGTLALHLPTSLWVFQEIDTSA